MSAIMFFVALWLWLIATLIQVDNDAMPSPTTANNVVGIPNRKQAM